jgi:iron complex outermembrane receptor protein
VDVDRYTVVSGSFQYRTPNVGRQVAFTGNVNNVLNARYWTPTNVGEAINGALSASVSW